MSRGDAPKDTERFGVEIEHVDLDEDGGTYHLQLGHQCDAWEIANGRDLTDLLPNLDRFIAELAAVREDIERGVAVVDHALCYPCSKGGP